MGYRECMGFGGNLGRDGFFGHWNISGSLGRRPYAQSFRGQIMRNCRMGTEKRSMNVWKKMVGPKKETTSQRLGCCRLFFSSNMFGFAVSSNIFSFCLAGSNQVVKFVGFFFLWIIYVSTFQNLIGCSVCRLVEVWVVG